MEYLPTIPLDRGKAALMALLSTLVLAVSLLSATGAAAHRGHFRPHSDQRPVTAIRTGSVDPDPTWTPPLATPRHPEYPSDTPAIPELPRRC